MSEFYPKLVTLMVRLVNIRSDWLEEGDTAALNDEFVEATSQFVTLLDLMKAEGSDE